MASTVKRKHTCNVRKCGSGAALKKEKKKNQPNLPPLFHTHTHTTSCSLQKYPLHPGLRTSIPPTNPPTPTCKATHPVCIKSNSSPKILIYEHLKSSSMRFILKQCYTPTQEGGENRHMIHSSPRSASCLLVLLIGNMWSWSKQPMGALASPFFAV